MAERQRHRRLAAHGMADHRGALGMARRQRLRHVARLRDVTHA
jgi:hypothetical protein